MKEKKVEKTQDIITNRVLLFFGFTAVFLWAISYLNRAFDYQSSYQAARAISLVLIFLGAGGIVAGLLWQTARVRSGKAAQTAVSGYVFAWFALILSISSAMMRFFNYVLTMRLLYVLLPVAAILYLIYYTYPREFFTVCTTHSALAFFMWVLAKASSAGGNTVVRYAACALGAGVCLLFLGLAYGTRKNGGRIRVGSRQIAVFGQKTSIRYLTALYVATLLLFAAALVLGAPFAFYAMFAILGFIFVAAVYYTVRML